MTLSYSLPTEGAAELARFQNEWIAELAREHRGRFSGLGRVPLQAPDLAADMVAEIVTDLQLAGIEIGSNIDGRPLDDPALEPVFAACESLGAAVFLHPWQALGADRLGQHGLLYSVGMPTETAVAAATLVLGGVLDRHPKLRIVLAHGGGAFLALLTRIDRCTAMLPGITPPEQAPSAYARRFWYDTLVYDPDTLARMVQRVGADRMMVGTDYPFPIAQRPAGAGLRAAGLTKADTHAVGSATAAAFLKLLRPG